MESGARELLVNHDLPAPGGTDDVEVSVATSSSAKPGRLVALDAFRGAVVILMILVDDAGPVYGHAIDHSPWDGIRLADVVMPAFLFAVGCSTGLSITSRRNRGVQRWAIAKDTFYRCSRLFALGLLLQGGTFPNGYSLANLRIPGILQRIAFVFFAVVLIELYSPTLRSVRHHVLRYIAQYVAMAVVLAVYALLIAPGFWDRAILGTRHMYGEPVFNRSPACSSCSPALCPRDDAPVWCSQPFDPEGSLSSISSIASGFAGLQFAHIFNDDKDRHRIPLNKNLYSLPYVFVTSAGNIVVLAALSIVFESRGHQQNLSYVTAVGRNAILVFVFGASGILDNMLTWVYWDQPSQNIVNTVINLCIDVLGPDMGLLVYVALLKIVFWIAVCKTLDQKGKYYTI
ncbi:unnamed protein product (mitochondrion) [Plasmodiophora brassicae]|uniref:Heparan-alpha-glucosaminide N-acetyltransferase catalytic domain-containing protein n=1 Tax=Plasmodiophora brassicae TaxID=37360 RepID=A0A3P3Y4E7_PLABS|nr:unnamed protein product [Plasmodiophora brassicae]